MHCPICHRNGYEPKNFTEAINSALFSKGISGRSVSRELGLTNATINRAFNGKTVGIKTLVALCDWAGIDIEWAMRSMVPADAPLEIER